LALSISKRGEKDIEGLTTVQRPNRLHVKRASKIRKLYNLAKEDDVKFYISKIGREIEKKKDGTDKKKKSVKRPKIQRLITDIRIRRKKIHKVETTKRRERTAKLREDYHKLVSKLNAKHKDVKHEETKAPEATKKVDPKAKATTATKVDPKKATATKPTTAPTTTKATTAPTTKTTTAPVKKAEPAPVKKAEEPKKAAPATKTSKKWKPQ